MEPRPGRGEEGPREGSHSSWGCSPNPSPGEPLEAPVPTPAALRCIHCTPGAELALPPLSLSDLGAVPTGKGGIPSSKQILGFLNPSGIRILQLLLPQALQRGRCCSLIMWSSNGPNFAFFGQKKKKILNSAANSVSSMCSARFMLRTGISTFSKT